MAVIEDGEQQQQQQQQEEEVIDEEEDDYDDDDDDDEMGVYLSDWSQFDLPRLRKLIVRFPHIANESDLYGQTVLRGVLRREDEDVEELMAFVTWLIDEKGAEIDCGGLRPWVAFLHDACLPELVGALRPWHQPASPRRV